MMSSICSFSFGICEKMSCTFTPLTYTTYNLNMYVLNSATANRDFGNWKRLRRQWYWFGYGVILHNLFDVPVFRCMRGRHTLSDSEGETQRMSISLWKREKRAGKRLASRSVCPRFYVFWFIKDHPILLSSLALSLNTLHTMELPKEWVCERDRCFFFLLSLNSITLIHFLLWFVFIFQLKVRPVSLESFGFFSFIATKKHKQTKTNKDKSVNINISMFLLVSFFLCLFDAGMSVEAKKGTQLSQLYLFAKFTIPLTGFSLFFCNFSLKDC